MKRNIKMHIAYDGTRYNGFQRLGDDENTIQEKIERCLTRLLEMDITVIGSSRTDAGVHALDQVVNFYITHPITLQDLHESLNKFLPEDIIVKSIEEVDEKFHSRYWNEKKTYLYRLYTHEVPPLFERKYVYFLNKELDLDKMIQAKNLLIGTHDFQGFCKRVMKKSTVRTIFDLEINKKEHEIHFFITADGFLYNMVRIIVGTLIEIGLNQREIESIHEIFNSGVRSEAGYLVPPQGLVLYRNYFLDSK